MKVIRKYSVLVASLVVALGIGHVMQSGTAPEHPAMVLRALETGDPETRLAAARMARESDLLPSISQSEVTPLAADVDALLPPLGPVVPPVVPPADLAPQSVLPQTPQSEPLAGPSPDAPQPPALPASAADTASPASERPSTDSPETARSGAGLPEIDLPAGFLDGEDGAAPLIVARRDDSVPALEKALSHPLVDAEVASDSCARDIALAAEPAALLVLRVEAPCDAGARVVVQHAGLAVTERIGATGVLEVTLPAFAAAAEVEVAFNDGPALSARATVPDMALYDRVAVQWQAPDAFQLHAFEFGAGFDDPGHVSAATPRDPGHALRATGGFLMLLGDSRVSWPLLAEVYTFPSGGVPREGTVAIEIEAMVTAEVCGREMLGETLEIHGGGAVRVRELTLAMPGCEAEGQYIVLKNALEALTIAAN